jgi:hypothetical protein
LVSDTPSADRGGASPEVATARQKFSCAACGAEAHWDPTKQALICPFCGTESEAPLLKREATTVIAEYDLIPALQRAAGGEPGQGWLSEKASAKCQSCRAVSVFDSATVGRRCDFCGSAQLVPYEQVQDAVRPESLLPMKVSEPQARDIIRNWYRHQWLAPNALAAKALTDTMHGVYLPYWTFDAKVHARWTADAGTYSYVRRNGKRVREVRWAPAAGELAHAFDDELVPGSTGVPASLLRRVEPFPTSTLIPYDPGYLAGWTVERYQVDLARAAASSRQQMEGTIRRMCADAVPGDTHRNLVVNSTFTDQRFKHILAPVWLVTYDYKTKSYQVIVNAVTGVAAGTHPWSWVKIALLALLALIVLAIVGSFND